MAVQTKQTGHDGSADQADVTPESGNWRLEGHDLAAPCLGVVSLARDLACAFQHDWNRGVARGSTFPDGMWRRIWLLVETQRNGRAKFAVVLWGCVCRPERVPIPLRKRYPHVSVPRHRRRANAAAFLQRRTRSRSRGSRPRLGRMARGVHLAGCSTKHAEKPSSRLLRSRFLPMKMRRLTRGASPHGVSVSPVKSMCTPWYT